MRPGTTVRPQKWSNVLDLYDDGEYSAIWGTYNGETPRCLGVRWNGDENNPIGYPSQGKYPVWYVEPDFIKAAVIKVLLDIVALDNGKGNQENLTIAYRESRRWRHES